MSKYSGINMVEVKKQNRASIFFYLNENGPTSRKVLAEVMELTPSAITQIVRPLIEDGVLVETGTSAEERPEGAALSGRKQVLIDVNYDYRRIFAVNIEADHTYLALTNLRGEIVEKKKIRTLKDPAKLLDKVATEGQSWIKESKIPVEGVSVGIVGEIDADKGSSIHAYGIWEKEVPVCSILSEKLSLPCIIENNVKAFAMAEMAYGYGRTFDNLMVLKWGPGVGSTLIINHSIFDGRHGRAGEIGHMIVEKNGKKCTCGRRGCLETRVSYNALSEKYPFEMKDFGEEYKKAGDEEKKDLDKAIDELARSLVNSMTVMSPNRVVLCGEMFAGKEVRQQLIADTTSYVPAYNEERILYTNLSDRESYVGPVASFVLTRMLGM